jgi:hypothetical protein
MKQFVQQSLSSETKNISNFYFSFKVPFQLKKKKRKNHRAVVKTLKHCLWYHNAKNLSRLLGPDVVAKVLLHVDEAGVAALGDLVDGLKVLVGELDGLEVALDARRGRALGQDDVAAADAPGDQDLGQSVAALLGDGVEGRVGVDLLAGGGDLVLGAEGRVGGGQDLVVEAELHELVVGQEGVDFDLVDGRLDGAPREQVLEVGDGPVGDADGLGLALLVQLLHGAPGGLVVLGELLLDHVLALLVQLGHVVGVLLGRDRPVDEEQVDVVQPELLERVVERPLDLVRLVHVVPHLGADEQVLALDAGGLLEEVADRLADLALVLVEPGAVEVAVAGLQRCQSCGVGLAGVALAGKGAEAHGGDDFAIVEGEGLSVRHVGGMRLCL